MTRIKTYKQKNRSLTKRQVTRVAVANARTDVLRDLFITNSSSYTPKKHYSSEVLVNVQDSRRFHPDDFDFARNLSGSYSNVDVPTPRMLVAPSKRIKHNNVFKFLSPRIAFTEPKKAIVCIRRNRRKEVLHALGRAGRKVAKPQYNSLSKIHCR